MDEERIAELARALAHPARVRILRLLAAQDACQGSEVFATLPLAQSTVSQHVAVLKEAGLLHATPQGTRMVYCIDARPLAELGREISELAAMNPRCSGEDA